MDYKVLSGEIIIVLLIICVVLPILIYCYSKIGSYGFFKGKQKFYKEMNNENIGKEKI